MLCITQHFCAAAVQVYCSALGILDMQVSVHAILGLTYDDAMSYIVSLPLPVVRFVGGLHSSTEML